mgnify:CR=1 FL=1
MAKLTAEELIEQFKELTLIELSEFVKQFEDAFGVTAAAPVAVGAAAAGQCADDVSGSDVVDVAPTLSASKSPDGSVLPRFSARRRIP